ncbi:MAG TPA: histone deacetylase [Longimicrobiales bacterium]|nr:histone deacetylase [Longimicrobiales bacterium]
MTAVTGFYLHPASPLHDTGWGHPEHQGRLRALAQTGGRDLLTLHGHVEQREAGEATLEDLLRVHTEAHVETVRRACELAASEGKLVALETDTKVSAASWEAALGSAGAAIAAAGAVAEGAIRTAFVAGRPPGHHATPDRAMGFCLFNSIAVAARWLQAEGHAERVLIVDWDVHHGNGTQDAFYADPTVYFLSLHQSPHYPGTGAADERGAGAGEGYTLNVPLAAATPRPEYRARFERAVLEATRDFRPDFVLVSAGFDVMAGDPLGGLLLEPEDLHEMTRFLLDRAAAGCDGRLVALLEGGYDPARLGVGAVAVIRALAGLSA